MLRKMIGSDDGKLKFKDQTLESVVLTGEEEEQKLQSMLEDKYRHSKMILNDSKYLRRTTLILPIKMNNDILSYV